MNVDDIKKIALPIKIATESYGSSGRGLVGGCTWTSKGMALKVERIIHEHLPHLIDQAISIRVGNYSSQGEFAFAENECEQAVLALQNVDENAINAPYHAWLEFDETIIDLTFLYSTLPRPKWKGMTAQPIYWTQQDGILPYELTLEYHPLVRFLPPRPGHAGGAVAAQDVDVRARLPGVDEEDFNLLGRIEKPSFRWLNSIWNRMFWKG